MEKQDFLRKYLVERKGTNSFKWDGMEEKFGESDLLPLWIADMEFKTCDEIIEALTVRAREGVFGYSSVDEEYYQVFSEWMDRRYHFPIKKEWVRFTTGCVTALAWMIHAFTEPGDHCMILTPVYYPFHNVVTNNHRCLTKVPLRYDNGYFTMDYDAIERAIERDHVKLFLMCSPHNPAGRVWTEEELDKVLAVCQKHGVLVASDEIHQDLTLGGNRFVPVAAVCGGKYRDIVITINSASKTFNMATLLHAHIIITDEKLRKRYDEFASGMNRTENNVMGLAATKAAYRYGEEWLNSLKEVIQDNYRYLKETFAKEAPGIVICSLEGTYLLFMDLRTYIAPEDTREFIQKRCRLAVDYGEWFAEGYQGFIRMNLATDPAFVKQAVDVITEEIKKMGNAAW